VRQYEEQHPSLQGSYLAVCSELYRKQNLVVCFAQRRVILQQFGKYLLLRRLLGFYLNQRYVIMQYICGNVTDK
jgi:hypothetical protein